MGRGWRLQWAKLPTAGFEQSSTKASEVKTEASPTSDQEEAPRRPAPAGGSSQGGGVRALGSGPRLTQVCTGPFSGLVLPASGVETLFGPSRQF